MSSTAKTCLVALCTVCALAGATEAAAKPKMVAAPANQGNIVVDQVTGEISYCILLSTGTMTPGGVCGKLGTATPSVNNPSLEIGVSNVYNPPFGARAFVTNVYTGQVTQCDYSYNSTSHSVVGSCAPVATVP